MNLRHRGQERRPQLRPRFPLSRARPAPRARSVRARTFHTRRDASAGAADRLWKKETSSRGRPRLRGVTDFFSGPVCAAEPAEFGCRSRRAPIRHGGRRRGGPRRGLRPAAVKGAVAAAAAAGRARLRRGRWEPRPRLHARGGKTPGVAGQEAPEPRWRRGPGSGRAGSAIPTPLPRRVLFSFRRGWRRGVSVPTGASRAGFLPSRHGLSPFFQGRIWCRCHRLPRRGPALWMPWPRRGALAQWRCHWSRPNGVWARWVPIDGNACPALSG